jgi:hypothetical protein
VGLVARCRLAAENPNFHDLICGIVKEHLAKEKIAVEGGLQFVFLSIRKENSREHPKLIVAPSAHSSSDVLTKVIHVRSAARTLASVAGYDKDFVVLIGLKTGARLTGNLVRASAGSLQEQITLAPEIDQSVASQPHKCFDRRAAKYLDAGLRIFRGAGGGCEEGDGCPTNINPPSTSPEPIAEV